MLLPPELPKPPYRSLLLKLLLLKEAEPDLYVTPDDESPIYLESKRKDHTPSPTLVKEQKLEAIDTGLTFHEWPLLYLLLLVFCLCHSIEPLWFQPFFSH